MIQTKLSYPPSANSIWRSKGSKVYRSPEYVSWRRDASWTVKAAVMIQGAIQGPYSLLIEAGRPDRRKRDIDNLIKPLSDALVHGGAIADDSDCETVTAMWVPDLKGVRITITPAGAHE